MSGRHVFRFLVASVVALVVLRTVPALAQEPIWVTDVKIDPLTPATLYAVTAGGVFKTTDGGSSWNLTGLTISTVASLAIHPQTPTTLYAGTYWDGLLKSVDGGETWTTTGLTSAFVTALAIDPVTPTTLYAGTGGGAVAKSMDGGVNWTFSFVNSGVLALAVDPLTPTTIYAGTEQVPGESDEFTVFGDLFTSRDGGATWAASDLFLGAIPSLAVASTNPTTLYAGTYSGTVIRNWMPIWVGAGAPVAVDPLTPSTVYAGGGSYKSIDSGATWNATGPEPGDGVRALALDTVTPNVVYAATVRGVYKTTDGGVTWNPTGPITWLHVSSLTLNPTDVTAGGSSNATITLNAAAPPGGVVVTFGSTDSAAVTIPATVTVAEGATSASFTVTTNAVTAVTPVTIWGNYGGFRAPAVLTVTPLRLQSSLSVNPASVTGGSPSIGNVMLSVPAPSGGSAVTLSTSDSAVSSVPAAVSVAAGATSATFPISTSAVGVTTGVTISAALDGVTASAILMITPPVTLSSVSVDPAAVSGGTTAIGTVRLNAPAPAGGVAVTLSSSNPATAAVAATVTVPAGGMSANFSISTAVCTSGSVTISAAYGGVAKAVALTVTSAADIVAIQRAQYTAGSKELRIEATSTNSTATLDVLVISSGALIGRLTNVGGGSYRGRFTWPVNPQNVKVKSSLCGSATSQVIPK